MNKFLTGFALFVLTVVMTACGGSADSSSDEPANSPTRVSEVSSTQVQAPTAVPATATQAPAATQVPVQATPSAQIPSGDWIRIPSIGVDAPVTRSVVGPSGQLEDPKGPDHVVLYDFSENWAGRYGGLPGSGNTYMSGKVDSANAPCKGSTVPPPCHGVFWDLNKVGVGAEIQVYLNQEIFVYHVSAVCNMSVKDGFDPVVRTTPMERLTLSTSGGPYENGGYTRLLIVIARRGSEEGRGCPAGTTSGTIAPIPPYTSQPRP